MRCPHCADRSGRQHALRAHVLDLLALIEHPDALAPEDALRVAGELLAWLGEDPPRVQHDPGLEGRPHALREPA